MATQVDIFVPLHAIAAASGEAGHSDPEQALWALAMMEASRRSGIAKPGGVRLLRKSLDARKGFPIGYRMQIEVFAEGALLPESCSRVEVNQPFAVQVIERVGGLLEHARRFLERQAAPLTYEIL